MNFLRRFEVPETRRFPWTIDIALPIALWVCFGLPTAVVGYPAQYGVTPLLVSTLLIVPLVLRRRYPLIMLVMLTIAGLLTVALLPYAVPGIVAVPIAIYSVARWVKGPTARISVLIGGVGSVIGPARWTLFSGASSAQLVVVFALMAAICVGMVLSPYVIGRRIQENAMARQAEQDAIADRYRRMAQSREQTARMAESKARTEIARELHDIVAHSLSVMIVQAEGGKALAAKHPEKAEEVLGTIAETGREALGEMRRIVGVLRADVPPAAEYTPTPGLFDIADMVERAGERVSYSAPERLPMVPTTLGLTVYRVVQESVTNFLKHAGPEARAEVLLQVTPRFVRAVVRDNGVGIHASSDGAGSGLKGMRERVSTMGGQLAAGPRPGGGYEVVALLPLPPVPGGPRPDRIAAYPDGGRR